MKKFLILFAALFFAFNANAQDNIVFSFDCAVFKGEENKSVLEIYYSVNQESLHYKSTEYGYEGGAYIDISIENSETNSVIYSNKYKSPSVVKDTSGNALNQKLIGQVNYMLEKGKYKLSVTGSDVNDPSRKDSIIQYINIGSNPLNRPQISDIELSTLIKKSDDTKSIFFKNTLEVIPNPSGLFGLNLSEVYYYYELYGMTQGNLSDAAELTGTISDLNNNEITVFKKKIKGNGESRAEYGRFSIDSLRRGSFDLKISLTDSVNKISVSSEKKFYVYNKVQPIVESKSENNYLRSEYAIMSEKNIDQEFEKTKYIMTDNEIKRYDNISSVNDKRKFLYDFWAQRDPNPNTQLLEGRVAYLKRINEVNRLYKEAYKEGWKTDRGRIYLIYGKPDDIEIHPFQEATKSYEIWKYYSVEGGGECDFVELQPTTGVYWLVNSTFRSELKNANWLEQLDVK